MLAWTAVASAGPQPSPGGPLPSEPAIVEALHTRVRYENDGRGERSIEARVIVLTEQGVRDWGQLSFAYSSAFETLDIETLEVRKADGSVVRPSDDAQQDTGLVIDPSAPVFTDHRQRHVALASLRPGDSLVVKVVWTVHTPPAPGHFWFAHRFAASTRTLSEVLEADLPDSRTVAVHTRPGREAPAVHTTAGRRVHQWQASYAPLPPDPSTSRSTGSGFALADPPDVQFTTYTSWSEVGAWFAGHLQPRATSADAIRRKARELTRGMAGVDERVRALFNFVAREVRYVSLAVGAGHYAARPPDDVLRTLYGDCKDKHALLAALLDGIGVGAYPALTALQASIDPDVPSPGQFDHVVTVIRRGTSPDEWLWVDATVDAAPAGYLAPTMRGEFALVASPAAALVEAPEALPLSSEAVTSVVGTVNAIGALAASVTQRVRGDGEVLLRTVFSQVPPPQHPEVAKTAASAVGVGGDVIDAAFHGLDRPDDAVVLAWRVRQAGFLDWAKDTSIVPTALPRLDLERDTEKAWQNLDDLDFFGPVTVVRESDLTLPPGYLARAPVGVRIERDYATYSSSYAIDGQRLTTRRVLDFKVRRLAAARSSDYLAFVGAIRADESQRFEVRSPAVDTPQIPDDASAAELHSAGYAAYMNGRFQAAVRLYEGVVEREPTHGNGWHALGLALWRSNRLDDAIAAFKQQAAINPFHDRAHRDLGDLLSRLAEWEQALAAYRKHLDVVPLDGSALAALGQLLCGELEYAQAAEALEKAVALGKADAWVHLNLGEALLALGREAQGLAAVRRGIEGDASVRALSFAARTLAGRGLELAQAAEWADRALSLATASVAPLTLESLTREQVPLLHDLAWAWVSRGQVLAGQRKIREAEDWLVAAWRYSGDPSIGEQLGRFYEAHGEASKAVTAYGEAIALNRRPWSSIKARFARLASAEAAENLGAHGFDAAATARAVIVQDGPRTSSMAHIAVTVDNAGTITNVRFAAGDESLKTVAGRLIGRKAPYQLPTVVSGPLLAPVNAACSTAGCGFLFLPFYDAVHARSEKLRWQ